MEMHTCVWNCTIIMSHPNTYDSTALAVREVAGWYMVGNSQG